MSESAARSFAAAAKAKKSEFDAATDAYYQKFIAGGQKPTANDVKEFAKLYKKFKKISDTYHSVVPAAMQGFGGPGDTRFRNAATLFNTLKKKAR